MNTADGLSLLIEGSPAGDSSQGFQVATVGGLTDLPSAPQIGYPSTQALPLEAFGTGTINPELFGVDDRGFNP